MAAAVNPSSNNLSPRYSSSDNLNSPNSRRTTPRGVSSPWTQIVRGDSEAVVTSSPSSPSADVVHQEKIEPSPDCVPPKDSSSVSPADLVFENQPESSQSSDSSNNAGKKPAWNKPSNGAVEVGLVMGAVSWPALSESARVSSKSPSPSDSSKVPADGSPVPSSQGTGVASSSILPQKQVTDNANPNSPTKNTYTNRHRSSKRSGGSSSIANNGASEALVTLGAGVETPHGNPTLRDHLHRGTNRESGQRGSQSHTGHDHPQQRSSFRRSNGGPHPRGDGSYHHNYGSRRDHDRGNHDWNPNRNYNGRDAHMQPQRVVPRGFVRPPPPHTSPFVGPPPVRPFSNPMGFEMPAPMVYIPPESFRAVPFMVPIVPPPMISPAMDPHSDPQLHAKIVTQIEYYFSNENLIRDVFLRQKMDDQGWVPINLIAGFNKVKDLTDNIQLILDALGTSTIVEVQGDKVRKRNEWMKWLIPSIRFTTVSGSQFLGRSSHDMLASRIQGVALETTNQSSASGNADIRAEASVIRSSSGGLYKTSSTAEIGQGAPQAESDSSISSGNSNERESC